MALGIVRMKLLLLPCVFTTKVKGGSNQKSIQIIIGTTFCDQQFTTKSYQQYWEGGKSLLLPCFMLTSLPPPCNITAWVLVHAHHCERQKLYIYHLSFIIWFPLSLNNSYLFLAVSTHLHFFAADKNSVVASKESTSCLPELARASKTSHEQSNYIVLEVAKAPVSYDSAKNMQFCIWNDFWHFTLASWACLQIALY